MTPPGAPASNASVAGSTAGAVDRAAAGSQAMGSPGDRDGFQRVSLMGLPLARTTEREVVGHVMRELGATPPRGGWIITPNLDILRLGVQQREIRSLLERADMLVADGMPLIWASKLQRTPLPERVAGSHLILSISEAAAKEGRSVYLLGGAPGAAEGCAAVLRQKFAGLKVVGMHSPPFGFEKDDAAMRAIREGVRTSGADVVFVALGFPKAERLIEAIRAELPRAWWVGVGISFSFVAGEVKRAPRWMQKVGLEWFHRMVQEPGRLMKRYLVHGIPFAIRLLVVSGWRGVTGRGASAG